MWVPKGPRERGSQGWGGPGMGGQEGKPHRVRAWDGWPRGERRGWAEAGPMWGWSWGWGKPPEKQEERCGKMGARAVGRALGPGLSQSVEL